MSIIRKIEDRELERIAELEQLIFSDPWSEKSLDATKHSGHGNIIVSIDEKTTEIQAYLIYYCMGNEIEVARIATSREHRGQGLAWQLMDYLREQAEDDQRERLLLEVRISNTSAISLYEKCGFQSIGIRKNYYTDPVEHGNIMEKVL